MVVGGARTASAVSLGRYPVANPIPSNPGRERVESVPVRGFGDRADGTAE